MVFNLSLIFICNAHFQFSNRTCFESRELRVWADIWGCSARLTQSLKSGKHLGGSAIYKVRCGGELIEVEIQHSAA